MKKYFDTVLNVASGRVLEGAQILVLLSSGIAATLYADNNGTPLSNPVTTDANGLYAFYVADGTYTLEFRFQGELVQHITDVDILDEQGPRGEPGLTGPRGLEGKPGVINLNGMRFYTPEQFGAIGDGVTNDQPAFDLLNAAIAAGAPRGAIVQFGFGKTYIGGGQRLNVPLPSGGGTFHRAAKDILYAANVSVFIVEGNGATLKFVGGQKFGAFDPVTGNPHNPGGFFADGRYRADIGTAVSAESVGFHAVRNLKIEGNSVEMIVGGNYGDTGIQLSHSGVINSRCLNVCYEAVEVRNVFLDGGASYNDGLTIASEARPFHAINCNFIGCGRNCYNQSSGNRVLFENCEFSKPTKPAVPVGVFAGTAPASCFDVEEFYGINRNIHFRDCTFDGRGGGSSLIMDSGDSAFITADNCYFRGMLWVAKPNVVIRGGRISGYVLKMFGSNDENATRFINVKIDDDDCPADIGALFYGSGFGAGYSLEGCRVRTNRTTIDWSNAHLKDVDVLWMTGTSRSADLSPVFALNGSTGSGLRIVEAIPVALQPATGYQITQSNTMKDATLISPLGKLKWGNAVSGFTGAYSSEIKTMAGLRFHLNYTEVFGGDGSSLITMWGRFPNYGAFKAGDIALYSGLINGGGSELFGWHRLTTGSAHVLGVDWREMYVSSTPKQAAAVPDLAGAATLADVVAKVNAMLASERTATLRAT